MYFKVEQICKSYDGRKIIEDISLELREGELVSLLGISGIGKSTLFNILSGLESPDSGHIYLEGKEMTGKAGIASYMQQKDLLMPYKTIIDNVSLPLLIRGTPKKEARQKALTYFKKFGLEGTQEQYPSQLSGGMRQRAALLRSYLFSSKLMLLDEPFSALDAITKHHIHDWYLEIMKEMKSPTLFITHDIDEAILLSDRIYIMAGNPGRLTKMYNIESRKSNTDDFTTSEAFMTYKKEILKAIKES